MRICLTCGERAMTGGNMREKTASERLLQTLDQQTITTLMCQMLDLEDGELLQWQVQEIFETNGAATGGVYRLTGTGRGQDPEKDWSLILKMLCWAPAGERPAGLEHGHVPHL